MFRLATLLHWNVGHLPLHAHLPPKLSSRTYAPSPNLNANLILTLNTEPLTLTSNPNPISQIVLVLTLTETVSLQSIYNSKP